jgi:hypothetical protein
LNCAAASPPVIPTAALTSSPAQMKTPAFAGASGVKQTK